MIELLESPKYLVALRCAGDLTAEDIQKAYSAAEGALRSNERVSLYAEVEDSTNITFEGLLKDLSNLPGQIGKLSRYFRAAVVTDKAWMAALVRVEGLVFSSIDVRVFSLDDKAKALAWASEVPEPIPAPKDPEAGIHFIQTTNDRVFAYTVTGRLSEKDIRDTAKTLLGEFKKDGKMNVLGRMEGYDGFDISALLTDDLYRMKYEALSKVDKYAIVGAKSWMRNFLELLDPLFAAKIRVFDVENEAEAWEWVGASQALLGGNNA